jgi:DNA-binding Lrp family transcriptional regulator
MAETHMAEKNPEVDLDAQILLALHVSPRATWREIAEVLNQNESTVARHARRLFAEGAVRVTGVLDHLRVGAGLSAYIRFRAQPDGVRDLAQAVARHPSIRYVAVTTGAFDVIVESVVRSPSEAFEIRDAVFEAHPFQRAQTIPVIRKFAAYEDWIPDALPPAAVEELQATRQWAPYGHSTWRELETLTQTELELIAMLREDGRTTYQELAHRAGLSPALAKRLTMSLVQRGCLRFRTLFDGARAGYSSEFHAWLTVKPDCIEKAGAYLKENRASRYVALTMDKSNILLHGLLPRYSDTYSFMTGVIAQVPGLVTYELSLVMQAFKRAWVLLPPSASEPPVSVGEPSVSIGEPSVSIGESSVSAGAPSVQAHQLL